MFGANSLVLEALQWSPTMSFGGRLAATDFHRSLNKWLFFTWPVWDPVVSLDAVCSLLALAEPHRAEPPRRQLAKRGVVEVYRSQRIVQN